MGTGKVPKSINALVNLRFGNFDRTIWHDRRNRMLVNKLGMSVTAQQHGIHVIHVIEP